MTKNKITKQQMTQKQVFTNLFRQFIGVVFIVINFLVVLPLPPLNLIILQLNYIEVNKIENQIEVGMIKVKWWSSSPPGALGDRKFHSFFRVVLFPPIWGVDALPCSSSLVVLLLLCFLLFWVVILPLSVLSPCWWLGWSFRYCPRFGVVLVVVSSLQLLSPPLSLGGASFSLRGSAAVPLFFVIWSEIKLM